MADSVPFQSATLATPAAGTSVSTEEVTTLNGLAVAAQHVQRVGIAIRTADGTAIDLPGDAAQGLDVDVTRIQGTVTVTGPLTDAQLRAAVVPVGDGGGSLTVDGTVAISGTVPVSGPLTDAQLRASAVPVSQATLPMPAGGTATAGSTSLTTTAAIQLHAGLACKQVLVQNDPDNVQDILVGDAASQTVQLVPGMSIVLPVSNLNQVYAKNVVSATQPANWIVVN